MSEDETALKVKVGALLAAALVLFVGFAFFLGDVSFSSGQRIEVVFENASGLKPGADVAVAGLNIGQVESLEFVEYGDSDAETPAVATKATVWIRQDHVESVRENSTFSITTRGVFGEPYIDIRTPSFEAPAIEPNTTVHGQTPPRMDRVARRASRTLELINGLLDQPGETSSRLVSDLGSLVRQLDGLLSDHRDELGKALGDLRRLIGTSLDLISTVNRAFADGESLRTAIDRLGPIADRLDRLTRTADGELGPLLEDTSAAAEHTRSTARRLDRLVTEHEGDVASSIANVRSGTEHLKALSADGQRVVSDLEEGKGTVGQLLEDRELYDDMRELLRILKRHPWKILWKD